MEWKGGLAFEGTSVHGSVVRTDAGREVGGEASGAKPTELLLYGIAGCTGIDILRILQKQRQQITELKIRVETEQNEDYPKPFHTVRVHYVAVGREINPRRLAKAIELSENKYCVVSQTVQEPAKVTTSWEIVEAE